DTGLAGFVDRIMADEAIGWAFDRRRPQRRVLVEARLGKRVLAEALADLPRRDLENSGKGDGRCGFRLKLPPDLPAADQERMKGVAVAGLRSRALKRARRFRHETVAPPNNWPSKLFDPDAPHVGFLERYVGGVLKGWAVDPNNPESPASVDIFDGEV